MSKKSIKELKQIKKKVEWHQVVVTAVVWSTLATLAILKVLGLITLSWWWITIPFWLPFAVSGAILALGVIIMIIAVIVFVGIEIYEKYTMRKNR